MNINVPKHAEKIAVGVAASILMGVTYRAERRVQDKIDKKYEDKEVTTPSE